MQTVIQVDDRRAFAFGLSWQTLDAMASRSSQINELRENFDARWIASFKSQGQENIGYAKHLAPPPKVVVLSAAGQVAISKECIGKTVLVLLEEQGQEGHENDVGVIGLINGNVVQDAFVKVSDVSEIRKRFKEQCARASADLTIVGKVITLPPVSKHLDWTDFLPPAPGKGIARLKSQPTVPVVALKADIPAWILIAVIGSLVAGAGIWYWQESSAESDRLRLLSSQNKGPDPAQEYADSAARLLAEPIMPAGTAFRELREHFANGKFDTRLAGWHLETIICGIPGCSARWLRDQGTFKEFVDRAPAAWGEIYLDPDGIHVMHNLPFKLTTAKLPAISEWPTDREFRLSEYSKWQKYRSAKFAPELRQPALMAVPPTVQPNLAATFPNALWAAEWDLQSSSWWKSEAFDSMPASAAVEDLRLDFKGSEITFNAKGRVYVRKN